MKTRPLCLKAVICVLWGVSLMPAGIHAEVRFGGFTDIYFYASDDSTRESRTGFKLGQLILHLNSTLSSRTSLFSELTFSPSGDGWSTEVERVILYYNHSDAFKPSAGKYHTPISWWNTQFHHGLWLQTSFDRPHAIRFGSRFVPVHLLGAMVEGSVFPGNWSFSYTGAIGNGRANNIAESGDGGDVDNARAYVVDVGLRNDRFYDVQVGGGIYGDRFTNTSGSRTEEYIASAFIVVSRETPELISEYFYVHHKDPADGSTNSHQSYYVHVAYRLPWAHRWLKPYARAEIMEIEEADPAFVGLESDHRRFLVGLRTDFPATVALKLEVQRVKVARRDYFNQFFTALSLAF